MIFDTVEELKKQNALCDLFIEAYGTLIGSKKSEMDIIKSAEENSLKNNASNNCNNYDEYKNAEKQIKKYYLHLSYNKFCEIASENPYLNEILFKVKSKVIRRENYDSFIKCGLRLDKNFEIDEKVFYADYVFATIKKSELEAMIKLEEENRKRKI